MSEHYDYDAIIIGAGIGGLVCGCYLAKAGLKILIVEKNATPGGYCTSFNRNGFRFDASVHSLSSFRKNGKLSKILNDLRLDLRSIIKKYPTTDIIITPEANIKINSDLKITIQEFNKYFPKEKRNLSKFFDFIVKTPVSELTITRSKTLNDLLNHYFTDNKLKTILATMILGLAGCPPDKISAFVATLIYREFIFDGGYYPTGGIQVFADTLVNKFCEYGGKIIYKEIVKKILVNNSKVSGVELDSSDNLSSRYVIAACDLKYALSMLSKDSTRINEKWIKKVNSLETSYSAYLVYLGMDQDFKAVPELKSNIWIIKSYDMDEILSKMKSCDNVHVALTSPSCKDNLNSKNTICLTTNMYNSNSIQWDNKDLRNRISSRLIELTKLSQIDIEKHVALKFDATPNTLYHWTYNNRGSAYGWASTCNQFGDPDLSQETPIEGLFITGHWSNESSGVTSVVNCGFITSNLILHFNKGTA